MLRILLAVASFLCFVTFVYLLAMRGDVLLNIYKGYIGWLKQADTIVVLPLFLLLSAGSSQITTKILPPIRKNDGTARMYFWSLFVFMFCLQMIGWTLNR